MIKSKAKKASIWILQDELCLDRGDDRPRGRSACTGGDGQGCPHQSLHQVRKFWNKMTLWYSHKMVGKYFCMASILNHRFKCECLKVAVLKNKWLAQHLGGKTWSNLNLLYVLSKSFRRHVFRCFQVWSARGCGSRVELTRVVRPYSCHSIVTTFKKIEINFISQQG